MEATVLTEFGKVLIFMILAVALVVGGIITASLIRPKRPTKEKKIIYECGEETIGSPYIRFNFRFYVVALIFIIFDVEVVLLFPWALTYREFGIPGFLVGIIFLILLVLGMAYEWRKGDLDWDRPKPNIPKLTNDKAGFEE